MSLELGVTNPATAKGVHYSSLRPHPNAKRSFRQVKDNLVEAIRKDAFVSVECKLVRPEALFVCTPEEEEMIVSWCARWTERALS